MVTGLIFQVMIQRQLIRSWNIFWHIHAAVDWNSWSMDADVVEESLILSSTILNYNKELKYTSMKNKGFWCNGYHVSTI